MSVLQENKVQESFRDSVATFSKEGNRLWIYPKLQKGVLYYKRHAVAYTLLLLMFIGPFLQYDGHPMFLFNVLKRIIIIFGVPFFPQDYFMFGLAMLTFVVFIILFSAAFGRLWCGWACPQTIFMEMIFRKIEYWIEGDAGDKKKLDAMKWNSHKISIKAFKHGVFYFISFVIANLFLSYIIGVKELYKIITEPISEHAGGFSSILIFSAVFYFVFSYMREQVCLIVCPYGRLQGVLLDKDSIVIGYDDVRGEPRGKLNASSTGDCVDCKLCVQVCPTAIDIRNGTQLECINCAACIDACDSVMTKIHKPKGLIRYASANEIKNKIPFRITPRLVGYAAVFLILFGGLVTAIAVRKAVDATILRTPGMIYQTQEDGTISNVYNINIVNKTFEDIKVDVKLDGIDGKLFIMSKTIVVPAAGNYDGVLVIKVAPEKIQHNKNKISINIFTGTNKISQLATTFFGPVKYVGEENEKTRKPKN